MTTVNIITLVPLLKGAIDRHGETMSRRIESMDGKAMFWAAHDQSGLAIGHMDADGDERRFAAERLEETAMMYLVAAKMLRNEAGGACDGS
jgi:hypothetical protein